MRDNNRLETLAELEDWQLVNPDQDLRGRPLMTRSGETLGTIRRMLVDRNNERVAAVVLDNERAVPIEDVEIRDGCAYIDEAGELPSNTRFDKTRTHAEQRIPIAEEELVIGKREVERGHVQVRSRVIEMPVHEEVRLRDEHVEVERRAVNEPVKDAERLFAERTVEVTESDEEAVVGKTARIVEEVVVSKEQSERVEEIDDMVRRTKVEVERTNDANKN